MDTKSLMQVGGGLIPANYQVADLMETDVGGLVISQLKRGIANKDEQILRSCALVIATRCRTDILPLWK
jgi:hypothetical protein